MLTFLPGSSAFVIAGLAAAAAPVLIHLLNRRRYRVTEWAAMQFLRVAARRNRRFLRLRDLLLLALRCTALALIGLAMARPFFSTTSSAPAPNQPVHAVLVLDNSLSMGYQKPDGSTLLDDAKTRAREFLEELPEGSIVSLVPLCGGTAGFSGEGYRTKQDARDALEQIPLTDRAGSTVLAIDLALEACRKHPELPTQRVVFLGDQQKNGWPNRLPAARLEPLPDLQVVAIAPDESTNTWVDEFRLQGGIASLDAPALFTAVVRHEGHATRPAVEVKLIVNGSEVDNKVIDLEPGQAREVTFSYRFDVPVEEGRPAFVPARVSIPHDRYPEDDSRFFLVPVLSAVPVLFVDQYGPDENPTKGRSGETRSLRRLMAAAPGETGARQLVRVRHLKAAQLDRSALESARAVIVAGVADPGAAVPLLREYVLQGGQLLIAAGGDFDGAAWTRAAWLDGAGLLPTPLADRPLGQTSEEATGELHPFFLSAASMEHDYFRLADTPREQLDDLFRRPLFFKAVAAELGETVLRAVHRADLATISDRRTKPADQLPNWLQWRPQRGAEDPALAPAVLADRWQPHALATYDNQMPFLIRRSLGEGQILFVTTGLSSSWNTLPQENAILIFDRILRSTVENTLPARNLSTVDSLLLPVTDRHAVYQLVRPDGSKESLAVDALGADQFGVTVRPRTARGIYRVTASRIDLGSGDVSGEQLMDVPFAVNGPASESEPAFLDEAGLRERVGGAPFRWVGRGEAIRLEGGQISGQDLWKTILLGALACLLLEMAVLVWPALYRTGDPRSGTDRPALSTGGGT